MINTCREKGVLLQLKRPRSKKYGITLIAQFTCAGHHTPKPFVRKALEKYLGRCIFARGIVRDRCDECGHDYFNGAAQFGGGLVVLHVDQLRNGLSRLMGCTAALKASGR